MAPCTLYPCKKQRETDVKYKCLTRHVPFVWIRLLFLLGLTGNYVDLSLSPPPPHGAIKKYEFIYNLEDNRLSAHVYLDAQEVIPMAPSGSGFTKYSPESLGWRPSSSS